MSLCGSPGYNPPHSHPFAFHAFRLKAVWAHGRELRAQYPEGVAVELDVWKEDLQSWRGYSRHLLPLPKVGPDGMAAAARLDRRRPQ